MVNDIDPIINHQNEQKADFTSESGDDRFIEMERDHDILKAQDLEINEGVIRIEDTKDLEHWAYEFQISSGELRATTLLVGIKLSEIKKYLSI